MLLLASTQTARSSGFCTRMQPWEKSRRERVKSSGSRRGVQVDVVLVGEHELDQAERVLGAGLLAHLQAAVLDLLGGEAGEDVALAVGDLEVLAGQVADAAGADVRHQLLLDDVVGHAPVGAEDEVAHHVGEDRRVVVADHLADDDAHGEVELVLRVVAAQDELRQVDHQRRVDVLVGQPAPALQRVLQLDDALGERDVERLDGLRRELAVFGEAVAMLIALDCVGERRGVDGRKMRRSEGGRRARSWRGWLRFCRGGRAWRRQEALGAGRWSSRRTGGLCGGLLAARLAEQAPWRRGW